MYKISTDALITTGVSTDRMSLLDIDGNVRELDNVYGLTLSKSEQKQVQEFFEYIHQFALNIYTVEGAKAFINLYNGFLKEELGTSDIFKEIKISEMHCFNNLETSARWTCNCFLEFISEFQQKCLLRHGIIDGLHRFYGLITSFINIEDLECAQSTVPATTEKIFFHLQFTTYQYTFIDRSEIKMNFNNENVYKEMSELKMVHTAQVVKNTDFDIIQKLFQKLQNPIYDNEKQYKAFISSYANDLTKIKGSRMNFRMSYYRFNHHYACSLYNEFVDIYSNRDTLSEYMKTDYNIAEQHFQSFKHPDDLNENAFKKIDNNEIITKDTEDNDTEPHVMKKVMDSLGQMLTYELIHSHAKINPSWKIFRDDPKQLPFTNQKGSRERVFSPVTFAMITSLIYCKMYPSIFDIMKRLTTTEFWDKYETVSKNNEVNVHKLPYDHGYFEFPKEKFNYQFESYTNKKNTLNMKAIVNINGAIGSIFNKVLYHRLKSAMGNDSNLAIQEISRNHVSDCFLMFIDAYSLIGENPYHFLYNCRNICIRTLVRILCKKNIHIEEDKFVEFKEGTEKIEYEKNMLAFTNGHEIIAKEFSNFTKKHSIFEVLLLMYTILIHVVFDDNKTVKAMGFKHKHSIYKNDDRKKWNKCVPRTHLKSTFTHHNNNDKPQPFLSALLPFKNFLDFLLTNKKNSLIKNVENQLILDRIENLDQLEIFHPFIIGLSSDESDDVRTTLDHLLREIFFTKQEQNKKTTEGEQEKKEDNDNEAIQTRSGITHSTTADDIRNEAQPVKKTLCNSDCLANSVLSTYLKLYNRKNDFENKDVLEIVAVMDHINDYSVEKKKSILKSFKQKNSDVKKETIRKFLEQNGFEKIIPAKNIIDLTMDDNDDLEDCDAEIEENNDAATLKRRQQSKQLDGKNAKRSRKENKKNKNHDRNESSDDMEAEFEEDDNIEAEFEKITSFDDLDNENKNNDNNKKPPSTSENNKLRISPRTNKGENKNKFPDK